MVPKIIERGRCGHDVIISGCLSHVDQVWLACWPIWWRSTGNNGSRMLRSVSIVVVCIPARPSCKQPHVCSVRVYVVHVCLLNLWVSFIHRRAVIGYGIDEEDQIDQWTEDAESVRICYWV